MHLAPKKQKQGVKDKKSHERQKERGAKQKQPLLPDSLRIFHGVFKLAKGNGRNCHSPGIFQRKALFSVSQIQLYNAVGIQVGKQKLSVVGRLHPVGELVGSSRINRLKNPAVFSKPKNAAGLFQQINTSVFAQGHVGHKVKRVLERNSLLGLHLVHIVIACDNYIVGILDRVFYSSVFNAQKHDLVLVDHLSVAPVQIS